jgi:hypothetical protein
LPPLAGPHADPILFKFANPATPDGANVLAAYRAEIARIRGQ